MIFYFTGTGNSLFAAQKLADEGEQIVSMVEALRSKAFHYTLKEGEKLGCQSISKSQFSAGPLRFSVF